MKGWNPPHVDAENYLGSVLQELIRLAREPEHEGVDDIDIRDYRRRHHRKERPSYASWRKILEDIDWRLRGPDPDAIDAVNKNIAYFYYDNLALGQVLEFVAQEEARRKDWDPYQGAWKDDSLVDPEEDDILSRCNELMSRAREAVRMANVEEIVQAIDTLMDELNADADIDQDESERWAKLLSRQDVEGDEGKGQEHALNAKITVAIYDLCVRLCELVAEDGRALDYIEWRQLEQVVATALAGIGFEIILTPPSKDGGKDIIAKCRVKTDLLSYYIEIKHWRSGKRVNSAHIFHFIEVSVSERVDGGLFISSSGYSPIVFSQLAELYSYKVRLGDSLKIVSLCQHFTRRRRGLWAPMKTLPEILFERTIKDGFSA